MCVHSSVCMCILVDAGADCPHHQILGRGENVIKCPCPRIVGWRWFAKAHWLLGIVNITCFNTVQYYSTDTDTENALSLKRCCWYHNHFIHIRVMQTLHLSVAFVTQTNCLEGVS